MIRMLDRYDKAIEVLLDDPCSCYDAWNEGASSGCMDRSTRGCLFNYSPEPHEGSGGIAGCLTMIKAGTYLGSISRCSRFPEIDRRVREDPHLPSSELNFLEGLPEVALQTFARYQREYDAAVQAEAMAAS